MGAPQELDRVCIILKEPQDPVNMGAVVRAMKNMGLSRLHLVRPGDFDARRIEGVAHTGLDVIQNARFFDRLEDAIAGANLVVGTTARGRTVRRNYRRPREVAAEIVEVARSSQEVAIVFGREDRGLSNEDLDLCSRVVAVPTDPDHTSLNLAQAVLIVAYEILLVAELAQPFKPPRHASVRATRAELESLFREVEASLHAVDFFKAHRVTKIMRTIREIAARADLNEDETALLKAMAYEVRNFIARQGIGPAD
jgi:TrmH family RNA methyltransferase